MNNWKLIASITTAAFLAIGALYNVFTPRDVTEAVRAVTEAVAADLKQHKLIEYKRDLQAQVWKLEARVYKHPNDHRSQQELKALSEELKRINCELYPRTCE